MGDWPPNNNSVKMQNAVRDMVDACNDAGSISLDDDAVKRGSYILAYSKTVVKKVCEKASPRKLDGKDILVVNASHWMSEIGARLSPDCDVDAIQPRRHLVLILHHHWQVGSRCRQRSSLEEVCRWQRS